MLRSYLDFEKPLQSLEKELEKVKKLSFEAGTMARHPDRPYALDYINLMVEDFCELRGDRRFSDDPAIISGFGFMRGIRVCIIGNQKGRDTKQKVYRNFGMPNPEGYRKAIRVMRFAEKFNIPIVTLIDTPGAYPGVGAEERGQAEAIARSIAGMISLKVPIVCIVTGEGGSGGALALGVGDRVIMLEFSIYSVISPEACATILMRDSSKAQDVAEPLRMTSSNAQELGVVDEIVTEPLGGAHRSCGRMSAALRTVVLRNIAELRKMHVEEMLEARYTKFRNMGQFDFETD